MTTLYLRPGRQAYTAWLALLLGWLPGPTGAQTVTATLVGTVRDTSQAVVPGVTVTATQAGTNAVRTALTNQRGDFTIASLAPGAYAVTAELTGFRRVSVDRFELSVNQTARLDFVLEVGQLESTVAVTAVAPVVASENSSVGQVIDSQQMRDLPLRGRNFFELALLSPGTTPRMPSSFVADRRPTPGGLNAPAFYVAGAREKSNGYLIDGIDAQDPHYLTPSIFPSVDAIQEFKLQTSSYSAEFGRSAAQVNVMTRSGSNDWHGSGYWFYRDERLESRSLTERLSNRAKAPLGYHQMGGTLSGPVKLGRLYDGRDRTFFFASYEGTRIDRGRTVGLSVPTEPQRAGDFSQLGFRSNRPIYDPATTRPNPNGPGFIRDPFPNNMIPASRITPFAQRLLRLYPVPTETVASGSNFFGSLVDRSDNNQVLVRVDHRLSAKASVFARYALFDGIDTNGSPIELDGSFTDVRTHNVAAGYTQAFGSRSLLELRAGLNQPDYLILQDGAFGEDISGGLGLVNLLGDPLGFGVPQTSMPGYTTIGTDTNPTTQQIRVWHAVAHGTTVRGNHSLKAGADLRRTEYNDRSERFVRGSFTFSGAMTADPQRPTATGVPVADMLLGLPVRAGGSNTSLAANTRGVSIGVFVQDDWRVHPKLTLNVGVRYEVNTRYTDARNRLTLFDPAHPGGRLLLSGTSEAYIPGRGLVPAERTPRGLLPADRNNVAPRIGFAYRPYADARLAVRAGYGVFYDITELQDLRTWVRNPPFGQVIELSGDPNANASSPAALRVNELFPPAGAPAARPNAFSPSRVLPEPYYEQWNLSVQREVGQVAAVEIGYLGSRGHNLAQRVNLNQAAFDADPARPTPILSRRPFPSFGNTIRVTEPAGSSIYHGGYVRVQRRFTSGFSYLGSYTFAKAIDNTSLIDNMVRNLHDRSLDRGRASFDIRHRAVLSASWDLPVGPGRRWLSTGPLSQVLGGWQINAILSLRSGFPFTVGANSDVCNCGASGQTAQQVGDPAEGERSRTRWFNTAAFTNPARGTLGNSGRNILDGPGSKVLDLSLFKQVVIRKARLQIRGEVFNAFNWDNLSQPGTTVGTANFGLIQSAGAPRSAQLAVKLLF